MTYNDGQRWDPQSSTPYSEVLVYIDIMPSANVTFHLDVASRPLKTINWYVEALPEDTNTVTAPETLYDINNNAVSSGEKEFVLYKSINARYNGVTPDEDFINFVGFTRLGADSQWKWRSGTKFYIYDTSNDGTVNFYYTRNSYPINFMDGVYVDGNGIPIEEPNRNQLYQSDPLLYGASTASYNEGGADYYQPEYPGYVFEGWYIDDACTQPYDFTTMPEGGITVYAKWRQIQYRVFLHPNVPSSDPSLDWGSSSQEMNFRVSLGGKVSVPTGKRNDYEMIGWYLDEACTQPFNADEYVLNETTVTTPYDKTTDFTDTMNQYGEIVGTGSNSDVNRFWINRKLDLYAKWRAKIEGAPGINVQYDAVEGKGAFPDGGTLFTDPMTYYLDRAEATGQAASIPASQDKQFLHWVIQRWDEAQGKYVDTEEIVYPGDTFEVLKAYAREESLPEDPQNPGVTKKYTVQLRSEYGDAQIPTDTHIDWYANYGENEVKKDENLQINQAVNIRPANTFTRPGYEFLGWARIPEAQSQSDPGPAQLLDLGEEDLYLVYHKDSNTFTLKNADSASNGKTVTQVAADEETPYHDMYAVWKRSIKVKVQKVGVNNTTNVQTPLANAQFETWADANKNTPVVIDETNQFTSDDNGFLFETTMDAGKSLYLEETVVPAGYYDPTGMFSITTSSGELGGEVTVGSTAPTGISDYSDWVEYDSGTDTYTVTLRNTAGVELPHTGGMGTTLYYAGGAVLLTLAGITLLLRRRVKA